MRKVLLTMLMLLTVMTLMAGCASVTRLNDAESRFAQAKNLGAEQKSPFEYYAAEAYLEWARHENVEGDSKFTNVFADESIKYADQAIQKSGGAK